MPSYHAMCRWNSGFFYQHPALSSYEYYWRVEPDVHFLCTIPYDVFSFMRAHDFVYGFNMAILDDARSFASLWSRTRDFMAQYPHLVHPEALSDMSWLLDADNGFEYNNCQFFSNFEIGDLRFFRAEGNRKYFEFLDQSGAFYYERFGDAPVHTLSVAMFAPKSKVWFFRDIGYQHDSARHCPPPPAAAEVSSLSGSQRTHTGGKEARFANQEHRHYGQCTCQPTSLDENFYKLVPMESPQVKPADTCIRLWLGGEWLAKRDGWNQEVERAFGGDGYGGYVLNGWV